jgi:hypothetical protein
MKLGAVLGKQVSIVPGGNPQNGGKMFFRKVPYTAEHPSPAQAAARAALATFAYNNLYGITGSTTLPDGRRISNGAYYVMTRYPNTGPGVFGGVTPQQRAAARHEAAGRSIERLNARAAELAGVGRLPARMAAPAPF